jgi:tetratricopeptide (TPR) repeat protein
MKEAVIALRAALLERTRERDPQAWTTTQRSLSNALLDIGERDKDLASLEEAAAADRELLAASDKREQPDVWSSNVNSLAYAIIVGGKRKSEVGEVEKVLPMLREAIQTQDDIKALPDIAYTLDTLCDGLIDVGRVRKDHAIADEAVNTCERALSILHAYKDEETATITEGNLARARALLAELR